MTFLQAYSIHLAIFAVVLVLCAISYSIGRVIAILEEFLRIANKDE